MVQTFEFQYFGGFSEKNIFWGMMKLWTFFGVITTGLFFLGGGGGGGHLYYIYTF